MSELKPCPFCGSKNIDPEGWASQESRGPACDDCGASSGSVHDTHAKNIAAWNTRAPSVGAGEYVLVPREPTLAMQNAFESRYFRDHAAGPEEPAANADPFSDGYRAMLHAAVQGGGQ